MRTLLSFTCCNDYFLINEFKCAWGFDGGFWQIDWWCFSDVPNHRCNKKKTPKIILCERERERERERESENLSVMENYEKMEERIKNL